MFKCSTKGGFMTGLNEINTAVYKVLKADQELSGLCGIFKGRRAKKAPNPSITIETSRLEPGGGEGVKMCDITVRAHIDPLSDSTTDNLLAEEIIGHIQYILSDREIDLDNVRAMPLIRGDVTGPQWSGEREGEVVYECIFGLVFVGM
jgi:hypothetical protein